MTSVLVTGEAGFLGSHLGERLIADDHIAYFKQKLAA